MRVRTAYIVLPYRQYVETLRQNLLKLGVFMKKRSYLLTIPLIQDGNRIKLKDVRDKLLKYDYFVFQVEKGDLTGYKHIQLYLENEEQIRFETLKRLFPKAHIEPRMGTKKQAYDYCTKEDTRLHGPFEYGDRPDFATSADVRRSKKEQFIKAIASGASDKELLMAFPTIFSQKLVEEYRNVLGVNLYTNNRNLTVTYISGPTGTGKSSYIRRKYNVNDIYVVSDYDRGPFDSYKGQDVIIFEEFRSNIPLTQFLQMLDIYPFELPCRFQNKKALYTKVYIVSNWDLCEQYRFSDDCDRLAFFRRLNYKIYVGADRIYRHRVENGVIQCNSEEFILNPLGESYKNCPIADLLPLYFEEC